MLRLFMQYESCSFSGWRSLNAPGWKKTFNLMTML
jgi:hypothetical protein